MYSDILILVMLSHGSKHGYEIKKHVEQIVGTSVSLNNKVLYSALKRFEEMHAVQREVVRQEGKPDRHTYSITDHGLELMQMLLQDASAEILQNDSEFLIRVSLFHLLEPEARLEILRTRDGIVRKKLVHIQEMRALATEAADDYIKAVITFNEQQHEQELAWIQSLLQKLE